MPGDEGKELKFSFADGSKEEKIKEIKNRQETIYDSQYADSFYQKYAMMFQLTTDSSDSRNFLASNYNVHIKKHTLKLNQSEKRDKSSKFTSEDYDRIINMINDFEKLCLCAHYPKEMNSAVEPRVIEECKALGIAPIDHPYFAQRYVEFRRKYNNGFTVFNKFYDTMSELLDEGMKNNAYTEDEYRCLMGFAAIMDEMGGGGDSFGDLQRYRQHPDKYHTDITKKYSESLEQCNTYHPNKSIVFNTNEEMDGVWDAFSKTMEEALNGTKIDVYDFVDMSADRDFGRLNANIGRAATLEEIGKHFKGISEPVNERLYYFMSNIGELASRAKGRDIIGLNSLLNEMLRKYSFKDFTKTTKQYLEDSGIRFMYSEQEYKMILGSVMFFENLINAPSKQLALDHQMTDVRQLNQYYNEFETNVLEKNLTVDFLMRLFKTHNTIVKENANKNEVTDYSSCQFKMGHDQLYPISDTFELAVISVREGDVEQLLDDYERALNEAMKAGLSEGLENIPDINDYGITDKNLLARFEKIQKKLKAHEINHEEAKVDHEAEKLKDILEVQALDDMENKVKEHIEQNQERLEYDKMKLLEEIKQEEQERNQRVQKEEIIEEPKAQEEIIEEPKAQEEKIEEQPKAQEEIKEEQPKAQEEIKEEQPKAQEEIKEEQPVQEEIKEEQPVQEEIKEEQPQQAYSGSGIPIPPNIKSGDKSLTDKDRISAMVVESVRTLTAAKTFVNSPQYKDLIKYLEEFKTQKGDLKTKLETLGNKIDAYINHKAADGVNPNTYKKLAAVQMTNAWVSEALNGYEVHRSKNYAQAYEDLGPDDNKKDLPDPKSVVDYNEVLKLKIKDDKCISKDIIEAADNCLCTIMIKTKPKDRPDLNKLRNEFNHNVKPQAVEKQQKVKGPVL